MQQNNNGLPYNLEKQYRLPCHDYSSPGEYFVTICSKDRKNLFGKVYNEKTNLSQIGAIIQKIWKEIPKRFKNVKLDKWIIMPNHLHGIVVITHRNLINQIPTNKSKIKNNPMETRYITLGKVIRWFKGKSSYEIYSKTQFKNKVWQSRFYDHIIQSDESLDSIREYIELNPFSWAQDS